MTTVQILRKARALIVKHGWAKRQLGNEHVGYCVFGAVNEARGES